MAGARTLRQLQKRRLQVSEQPAFDLEDLSNILDLLQTLLDERHATEIPFTWRESTDLTAIW